MMNSMIAVGVETMLLRVEAEEEDEEKDREDEEDIVMQRIKAGSITRLYRIKFNSLIHA